MKKMYNTKIFTEVWDEADDFKTEYKASGLYDAEFDPITHGVSNLHNSLTDANITLLYYMLYSRYGNSPIANMDENQFKYKVFSIIFQYGPTWQKELELQDTLRNLTEAQLLLGAKTIYNKAYNDATAPSTSSLEETPYINEQTTANYKKNKLGAYAELLSLLKTNVTDVFLDRFKNLFSKFLFVKPLLYETEVEEDENDD